MTVKPTLGSNKSVGNTLGAAEWNLSVLQQGNWTQEVLAGTNADKIPGTALAAPLILQGQLNIANDTDFNLQKHVTLGPLISFDSADILRYDRAGNYWSWQVNLVEALRLDSTGSLSGPGIYRSTEVTITTGNNANFAHGLTTKPSFVYGVYGTVSVNNFSIVATSGGAPGFGQVDATNINVLNTSGSTQFVLVRAIK